MDKLIFIENEYHAKEYLENKEKFKEYLPITFNFLAEQMLSKNGIKFKLEEEYETTKIYFNLTPSSLYSSKKIFQQIKIFYRAINLMYLFYYDIHLIISSSKKYLRLLKEIIKKENPQEIAVFEEISKKNLDNEFSSMILPFIFKKKIIKISYSTQKIKEIRDIFLFKIISYINIFFTKNPNIIFNIS